jgi:hypothetical protein
MPVSKRIISQAARWTARLNWRGAGVRCCYCTLGYISKHKTLRQSCHWNYQMTDNKIIPHTVPNTTSPQCKGKGKIHPRICHEGPEREQRYSSTLHLTSALEGVSGQRHTPAGLLPGKTRCPLYRRLGGPYGRSGQVRKISPPPVFDPWTVQSTTYNRQ